MSVRVCKLIYVATHDGKLASKHQAKQSNKYYNMTDSGSGVIDVEYGRVDETCVKITKPSCDWEKIIREKTRKGYRDVTHLLCEVEEVTGEKVELSDISDKVIDQLFKELQAFANKTIQANYKVSSHKVTQAMIDEAQLCVDKLAFQIDVNEYNKVLLDLFHIIPRKMDDVRKWLIDTNLKGEELKQRCIKILDKEQSTLDVMAGQVIVNTKTDDIETASVDVKRDILDALGLDVSEADKAAVEQIKKLLGANASQFRRAYSVTNRNTQERFDEYMKTVDNDSVELFWHGSRNENWLNIISTGLLIRPSGAVYSGSMFGDGIYFADKAQKSIGYTSLKGSYWASGNSPKAYLALFSVHVGKQKEILRHTNDCYRLCKSVLERDNFHSVFAKGGADLRNNEYIVYDKSQCTISYLVEIN